MWPYLLQFVVNTLTLTQLIQAREVLRIKSKEKNVLFQNFIEKVKGSGISLKVTQNYKTF